MNTVIMQGCIQLIKGTSKDVYDVKKIYLQCIQKLFRPPSLISILLLQTDTTVDVVFSH